ncbi:pilus assembly protein TadG-related protein [Nocardioides sp. P5_E3]
MRRSPRRRGEDGAVALMTVFLSLVIFGAAAIAIDIATLAMQRQKLHDAVDAAAHAGAYAMPGDGASAIAAARSIAFANDPDLEWDFTQQNPKIRLWCVVASTGTTPPAVKTSQIPSTCYPGTGPYTTSKYPDLRCNGVICKIPCAPSSTTNCNTVEVVAQKDVPFGFANIAFGEPKGSTGSVASAACKGSCGAETPNPMDVVVLADRTASLSDSDRGSMVSAVKNMMLTMDPTMHFLSIGTIDKSAPTSACPSNRRPLPPGKTSSGSSNYKVTPAWTAADLENTSHKWIPSDFSRDYVTGAPGARVGKSTDPVYKTINCITSSSLAEYGTHLAAPLKEGARKLLNLSGSNLGTLSASYPRPGDDDVTKVLILETDGAPNEFVASGTDAQTNVLTAGAELRHPDGNVACEQLLKVAASAKAQKIVVITIGFGEVVSAKCNRWNNFGGKTGSTSGSSKNVRDVLAAAASPHPGTGAASTANSCSGSSAVTAENADGDFFFCAASGSELADLFRTALNQVSKGVRLVKLPN